MTTPVQREDAYLVGLILRDFPHRVYWEEGRQTRVCDLRAGDTCIHDLKRDPVSFLEKPHHELFFYLPRAALVEIRQRGDRPAADRNDFGHPAQIGIAHRDRSAAIITAANRPADTRDLYSTRCRCAASGLPPRGHRPAPRSSGTAPPRPAGALLRESSASHPLQIVTTFGS